jgi:tetratricopeptide (TPR) repeat protein
MPFRFVLLLLVLLLPGFARAFDESSRAWKDAETLYKAGDFTRAGEAFRKIAEDEKALSAALCHNIANCEYKLDNKAAASIWYRRALALDPFHPEARQNLRFLHTTTGYLVFQRWIWGFDDKHAGGADDGILYRYTLLLSSLLKKTQWQALRTGALWLLAVLIVWLVWLTPRAGRRWPLVTGLCLAAALLCTSLTALLGKSLNKTPASQLLISTAKDAALRSAPAEAAGSVISLPPGSELLPLRTEGNWTYCQAPAGGGPDGPRGWIRTPSDDDKARTAEPFWPWPRELID